MAGGRGKIHEHPNASKGGFHVNPQNINRKGTPKKSYKDFINDLKSDGYKLPTRTEYYEMIGMLLVMTKEDLDKKKADPSTPYWIKGTIEDLQDKKKRDRLMIDHRDWMFGKAAQHIDHTTKGEAIQPIILNIGNNPDNSNGEDSEPE